MLRSRDRERHVGRLDPYVVVRDVDASVSGHDPRDEVDDARLVGDIDAADFGHPTRASHVVFTMFLLDQIGEAQTGSRRIIKWTMVDAHDICLVIVRVCQRGQAP